MSDKPKEPTNPDVERLQAALNLISEHFDSVQIFANRHESGEHGGTVNLFLGSGNWFSRYGQIRDWVLKEEEVSRAKARQTFRENFDQNQEPEQ